jgi:hypothetical protein
MGKIRQTGLEKPLGTQAVIAAETDQTIAFT